MSKRTVSVWTLVSLIIGSTIGSGIFALPQNIGSVASPGAMLTGWAIAGVGMLSIAFVFQILAVRKPHLDSGVYSYVRAGLGDFIGFTSGMGYWLGSVMAQVGYATLFFNTLGYYFPGFSNRWVLALSVSALSWLIFFGLTRGLKQAAVMNAVTTVAKLVPIVAFIVLVAFLGFSWDRFTMDFWGSNLPFADQLKGIMLYTVWVFIGIEGASVYSKQARVRSDVGKATIIGFLSVLGLLMAVSTLSYGVLSQEELAALPDNSMGAVLEEVVGPWGGVLISVGLCLSVLGAYVSWQMLCAEPIVMMAQDGLLPRSMGRHNENGSPVRAQLLSTLAIQFFVVVFFLSAASYNAMVQLATIMYLLPYIFSSIYLVLLTIRGKGLTHPHAGTRFDDSGPVVSRRDNRIHLLVGLIGSVYSLWLIYAADLVYVLLGALAVVPGMVPYIWNRRRQGEQLFNSFERVVVAIVLIAALVAVAGLATGSLVLE
ncbi:amino acid permease [Corynebacterium fournieri]|uniref:amino acid permease n=1 Tax=Corynebacterium fournieri TaxID=1852390 RepID=UPI000A2F46F8|nr:amino acid permease [Corynebacterium fournieri]WJY96517.1 Arginine/ornithine antiporter [Corynebacterium fournieri]